LCCCCFCSASCCCMFRAARPRMGAQEPMVPERRPAEL
jgi:hypothetical protein